MKVVQDLGNNQYEILRSFLIYGGAADITRGSLVMEGAAAETLGAVIPATSAAANVVGLLTQLHDYSVAGDWTYNGTLTTATNRPEAEVDIRPFAVIRAEMKVCASQTCDADNGGADTAISLGTTCAGGDVLGGSYVYDSVTGDIRFVEDHSAAGDFTLNTATSADWDTISPVIVPQRLYGSLTYQGITPSATQMICEGNETVLWAKTLDHYIVRDEEKAYTRLNPGIHDNISATNPRFFVDFVILDHAFNNY